MWKKVLTVFVFIISAFTMAYTFYNQELNAAASSPQFYGAYEKFDRTGKTTIRFSGIEWTIVHADPSTGKGILLSESMGGLAKCKIESIPNFSGAYLTGDNLTDCQTKSNDYYKNNYNNAGQYDVMGKIIKDSNPNLSPSVGYEVTSMTLAQYKTITNYDGSGTPPTYEQDSLADYNSNLRKLINNTWLNPTLHRDSSTNLYDFKVGMAGKQIYYWGSLERIGTSDKAYDYEERPNQKTQYQIYNGYDYIAEANSLVPGEKSQFTLAMEINLPQKNFISKIQADKTDITYTYDDSGNAANALISNITTESGKGPYHFYVYDTDASGNGSYTTPSANFQFSAANGITTNGKISVNLKKKLPVGDYYFKVKVIDESTNTSLYTDPTDFTKDSYRTKVTDVIHVSVTKAATTLAFTNTNTIKMKNGDPAISETITTNHGELTVGGANACTYTLSNGIGGTGLTVTNDASNPKGFSVSVGSSTSANLPATFTLTATTPTTQNYKGATTTKSILVFKEISALSWLPVKSGNFATSDVAANAKVGELLASDGIANYTYALTQPSDSGYNAADAADNALFIVDNTPKASGASADVKTGSTLGSGIYHIQFKVTDDNGDVVYQKADINVSTNNQPPLEFKENGSTITKKTIYFDETSASVKAEGGLSSIPSLPQYSLSNNQISGITASDYLKVDATTGLLTPKKITQANRPIRVKATKAGDAFYSNVSADIEITILPAKQSILFDNNINPRKIKQDDNSVIETAQGILTSNGAKGSGVGDITYTSSDPGIAEIHPTSGAITPKQKGTVTITAALNDAGNANYDENYETATVTKQVYIYEGLAVTFTPTTIPLQAENTAKANAIAGKLDVSGNSGNVSYAISTDSVAENADSNLFTVDALGQVHLKNDIDADDLDMHGVSNPYKLRIEVTDSNGTQSIDIEISIQKADNDFYFVDPTDGITKIYDITKPFVANGVFPIATKSSNGGNVTYKIKTGEATDIITVNGNNATINKVGTTILEASVAAGSGYDAKTIEIPVIVTAVEQGFIYTDKTLSHELPKTGNAYHAYTETYAPNKTFQVYTKGNPVGTTVSYQLKSGSPTDVISVDSDGLVHILNASLNNQLGKVVIQATSHDPTGNYSDKTIELPVNIEKGTRVISFADDPIYVTNGTGAVTPVTEVDGNIDSDGDVLIEVDANEDGAVAWTNDNKTIQYNYSGSDAKDIKIHATKQMDRNYKAAEADGTIHIMAPDENVLAITSPGQIRYGDHFTIRSTQFDAGSTNVQYKFETDISTYLSNPTVNGNIAEFDAIKYSGSNKTTIKVTRTADGETPLSKTISVQVLPKEITITIDDKEKYKGEANPPLTYQDFNSQLVSWGGVQDIIQENDIKLSTAAQTNSQAGSYAIKGDANSLNDAYPNYSFKFVDGTLTIKEDNIEDSWYHMEIADGSHTPYNGDWTNQNVDIISDHAEYVNLSLDQSTWNPQKVTVGKEGEINQSFWMKKNSGAITKEKQEIIRIDKTPPKVKGIKAKDSNNKLQDIIHQLTFGIYFKPGTTFEITTSDENGDLKVSGTKEISYKIYKLQTTARSTEEEISNGVLSVTDEKASITISETSGTYRVCVIPTDHAGNTGEESCHEVTLKKINIDVDGDGKLDFNDPDGDGCPDLNIVLGKDEDGIDIKLNIDNDGDGIPELNIDTNGDGKADINVDQDGDGKPDLNIASHITWNPDYCVIGQAEEYCTDQSIIPDLNIDIDGDGRPDINVDLDHDGIPDIDIDTDGDGKADINIDIDKDGSPDENITKLTKWEPDKSFEVNGTKYQTMTNLKPDEQIKTDTPSVTDKPAKPNDNTELKEPQNTSVQGNYYPGNSIGGANTGDVTNLMMYLEISLGSLGILCLVIYKKKEEH